MNRKELLEFVSDTYGVLPDRPFADDQSILVFRHEENRKWFGVIMTVSKNKLGINENGKIDIVNLKCAEEVMHTLHQEVGIYPAYHMNKHHWISVLLDDSVDSNTLAWLLDISFQLTQKKKK